ncbi:hypothetical protein [Antarctobacter jejuensis]|uniref:hypothetical protein n=1 Tax=Antarctobacter jejuensis TaxID=1439938 RepID=UPI003FCF0AAA
MVLCLPRSYRRFPGPVTPPPLPAGVTLLWADRDDGPATKLLPTLRAFADAPVTYCDDDCLYADGWLDSLCAAARPGEATAASGWSVTRLKRQGAEWPFTDIAQGFSGVRVTRGMFAPQVFDPPNQARMVDDIWLSAMLALGGTPLRLAPAARERVTPLDLPAALQHETNRAQDNAQAAALINSRFGLWPDLPK